MSRRTDAQLEIDNIKKLFVNYFNKEMTIRFDTHCSPMVISDIILAKITTLENKPAPRIDSDGKKYRPSVMTFITDIAQLHFIIEDVVPSGIANGVLFTLNDTLRVEMRLAETPNTNSKYTLGMRIEA